MAKGLNQIRSIVLQPDGKIIAAGMGTQVSKSYYEFAIARYNADGSLDSEFGTNGIVLTPMGSDRSMITSAVLQPNGRILAAGSVWDVNENSDDIGVARYLSGLTVGVVQFSSPEEFTYIYPKSH